MIAGSSEEALSRVVNLVAENIKDQIPPDEVQPAVSHALHKLIASGQLTVTTPMTDMIRMLFIELRIEMPSGLVRMMLANWENGEGPA